MEKELKDIYYDVSHAASFGSIAALRHATNNKYSTEKIKKWLSSQDPYTLHKRRLLRFPRQRYYVTNINDQFQADLLDVSNISKSNNGFNFLLCVIDIFSKRAFVEPLKNKSATSIIQAFSKIFKNEKCLKLEHDKGKEFISSTVKEFFKKNKINAFVTNNPDTKASVIERFQGTLRRKMWRYFSYAGNNNYIPVLQSLVESYNNAKHSAIGMAPNQVTSNNVLQVWKNLYGGEGRYKQILFRSQTEPKFKVKDKVRITREKYKFEKGATSNFTHEIFLIAKVIKSNPPTYRLKDLKHESITGRFYEPELQKVTVTKNTLYKIDKIIGSRGRGVRKQLLVKWKGYSEKFNSYILAKDLVNYGG